MDLYEVRKQLSLGVPLTSLKLRVTDYSRVSTDNIRQLNSLHNQICCFDEMIMSNDNWVYVKGYVDEGITGTSDVKRDNFMKMIEDGKRGKFDLIITKEISRFSRNTLDSIKYTRELLQCGVAVLFYDDNINTALPDAELRLTIMASMAQDEVRRLSERVKFGMNMAIASGHILGNDRLFGYHKNKDTGNLEVDSVYGDVVRLIYDMYVIEDMSLNKIVNYLNENNIRTSFGKRFSVSTLSRMLKNPKYKGYYCGRKTEVVDYMTKKVKYLDRKEWIMYEDNVRIPPLVSEKIWNSAFLKLKKRGKKFGSEFKDKVMYQRKYLLSARLFCSNHNGVFHRRKLSKNSDEIVWYCSSYLKKEREVCNVFSVRQSEIYYIFNEIIRYLSIDLEEVIKMIFELYDKCGVDGDKIEFFIRKNNVVEKCFEKLMRLILDKVIVSSDDNGIGLEVFLNFSDNYLERERIFDDENGCFFEGDYEFLRERKGNVRYMVRGYCLENN